MPTKKEEDTSEKVLPFSMKHLPDYFNEKAQRELNETPERGISALEELKEMAREHKALRDIDFEEDFLLQFLRCRKFDVQRSLKQLANFIHFRNNYGSLFRSVDIDRIFSHPSGRYFTVLPYRCPDGCTIALFKLGLYDPKEVSIEEFKQVALTLFFQSLRHPMTQINGFKLIYDFSGTSLAHLRHCTPLNLYVMYHAGMECFPGRYKGYHMVNKSATLKAAWTFFKGFLSQKLKNRVFFHTSPEELLEYFPASVLPAEYGGTLTNYHMTEWLREANRQQGMLTHSGQRNYD